MRKKILNFSKMFDRNCNILGKKKVRSYIEKAIGKNRYEGRRTHTRDRMDESLLVLGSGRRPGGLFQWICIHY